MQQFIYIKEAILCLKAHRLRSFLALLGLLIGSASVVALITIGFLAKQTAIDQFKNLGTQKLYLHIANDNKDELAKLNTILTNQNSAEIFNNNIIADVHLLINFFKPVFFNHTKLQSYQLGIGTGLNKSLKLNTQTGRLIHDQDYMKYFAVIGETVANNIKQETKIDVKIGDYLNIDNNYFTIIGILKHWPVDPLFNYDINRSILIPFSTAQYLNNSYTINEIYIDVNHQINPQLAENYLKNLIMRIIPNAKLQFSNAEQILKQLEQQAQILTILLGTIGAISLLVGAIGVMNIMLVSIVERKAEIGLRMAIGATPQEIRLQFLCETICLTSIGGILGTLLGITIPFIITLIAGWQFTLPLSSVLFGLTVSLGVGLIAGFYPAFKASKMLPVACLNSQ
jgi:putative ABC transport system permease protein